MKKTGSFGPNLRVGIAPSKRVTICPVMKEEDGSWDESYIGSSGGMIVGFGEGLGGELLVFHWTGEIVHIG